MDRASRGGRLAMFFLASIALPVGAGCGSGNRAITLDEAQARIEAAICAFEVSCLEMPDLATCMASVLDEPGYLATLDADIAAGKVIYDGVMANKCVSQYVRVFDSCSRSQMASATTSYLDENCSQALKGIVAAGGSCFFNEECADGGSCQPTDTTCRRSRQCCAGSCVARPAPIPVGGDCSALLPNQSCASGSYCNTAQSGSSLTCVTPSTVEGTPCTGNTLCANPMYCDVDSTTNTGTCKRPAATGGACNPEVGSLSCDMTTDYCDATSGKCTPRLGPGSACTSAQPSCVGYTECDGTMCVAHPRSGEACDPLGPSCLGGLECDATMHTCTPGAVVVGACM